MKAPPARSAHRTYFVSLCRSDRCEKNSKAVCGALVTMRTPTVARIRPVKAALPNEACC